MTTIHSPSVEAQVAGTLESLALTEPQKALALDLLCSISVSIERHLTPQALTALSMRGITRSQAIEFLAFRALEAVIEDGKRTRG